MNTANAQCSHTRFHIISVENSAVMTNQKFVAIRVPMKKSNAQRLRILFHSPMQNAVNHGVPCFEGCVRASR